MIEGEPFWSLEPVPFSPLILFYDAINRDPRYKYPEYLKSGGPRQRKATGMAFSSVSISVHLHRARAHRTIGA